MCKRNEEFNSMLERGQYAREINRVNKLIEIDVDNMNRVDVC